MTCKHPKQPDPWNLGKELPCAWPSCTPIGRVGVIEKIEFGAVAWRKVNDQVSQMRLGPNLQMLTRGRRLLGSELCVTNGVVAVAHTGDCAVEAERRRLGDAILADSEWVQRVCTCTEYFWLAGDEAEQAQIGEAFEYPRRVRALELELVKRDQAETEQRGEQVKRMVRAIVSELAPFIHHTKSCVERWDPAQHPIYECSCGLTAAIDYEGLQDVVHLVVPATKKQVQPASRDWLGRSTPGYDRWESSGVEPRLPRRSLIDDMVRAYKRSELVVGVDLVAPEGDRSEVSLLPGDVTYVVPDSPGTTWRLYGSGNRVAPVPLPDRVPDLVPGDAAGQAGGDDEGDVE